MIISNCRICNRLFKSNGITDLCPNCIKQDEQKFSKIKEYLSKYPGSSILDIATNLDVSIRTIKRYLRESRLEITKGSNKFLLCEKCGKPIRSGKYCDSCILDVHHNLKATYVNNSYKKSSMSNSFHHIAYTR